MSEIDDANWQHRNSNSPSGLPRSAAPLAAAVIRGRVFVPGERRHRPQLETAEHERRRP